MVYFVGLKLVIYFAWCRFGVGLLAPSRDAKGLLALALAAGRVAVGFALGFAWAYTLQALKPAPQYSRLGFDPFVLVAGLVVLRWVVWSVISWVIQRGFTEWSLLRARGADHLWRLGGIAISTLGDVVVLAGLFFMAPC